MFVFLTLAFISIGGSLLYYFGTVTTLGLGSILLLSLALVIASEAKQSIRPPVHQGLSRLLRQPAELASSQRRIDATKNPVFASPIGRSNLSGIIPWLISITLPLVFSYQVLRVQIVESTRSLWLEFSPAWLILPTISFVLLVIFAKRWSNWQRSTSVFLILFSILSISALAYPLGYGFDPFIHRSTVEYIAANGTITPKPLYYIGQYAIELTAVKIFHLPLFWFDILLVPTLFSIIGFAAIRRDAPSGRLYDASWCVIALLPLAAFIQTTPFSLGLIFLILTLIESRRLPGFIFALAASLCHPLTGLPALGYWVIRTIYSNKKIASAYTKKILLTVATVLTALSIPLAFIAQSIMSGTPPSFGWPNLTISNLNPLPYQADALGDTIYLILNNFWIILTVLAGLGLWWAIKKANVDSERIIIPASLSAIAALVTSLILSGIIQFPFLIEYERLDFAGRFLTIATIFALPAIGFALSQIHDRIKNQTLAPKVVAIAAIALLFAANLYRSLPRHDNYARAGGFNLSSADLSAVNQIDQLSADQPYVVLADQTLSSAVLHEFGFKTYFHNQIYFYPVPTGGPLYQIYLEAVEQSPSRSTIQKAADLTGAKLVYLAVHKYWWQSAQIWENAKSSSDRYWLNESEDLMIFEYRF